MRRFGGFSYSRYKRLVDRSIPLNSIDTEHIKDGAITAAKLAGGGGGGALSTFSLTTDITNLPTLAASNYFAQEDYMKDMFKVGTVVDVTVGETISIKSISTHLSPLTINSERSIPATFNTMITSTPTLVADGANSVDKVSVSIGFVADNDIDGDYVTSVVASATNSNIYLKRNGDAMELTSYSVSAYQSNTFNVNYTAPANGSIAIFAFMDQHTYGNTDAEVLYDAGKLHCTGTYTKTALPSGFLSAASFPTSSDAFDISSKLSRSGLTVTIASGAGISSDLSILITIVHVDYAFGKYSGASKTYTSESSEQTITLPDDVGSSAVRARCDFKKTTYDGPTTFGSTDYFYTQMVTLEA